MLKYEERYTKMANFVDSPSYQRYYKFNKLAIKRIE